ncbi:hypothetical protein D9M68_677780 [compost metagenome]
MLNSAVSVPGWMSRCSTFSLPATCSQIATVAERRGSTMMILAAAAVSPGNHFFFLSTVAPERLATQWFRK